MPGIAAVRAAAAAFGSCLTGHVVASERLGGSFCVTGAALWRWPCGLRGRRSVLCVWASVRVASAAFGSCLTGLDVVTCAARGIVLRDRRSTLEMAVLTWQAQYSVHLGVCSCGRGSIWQLSNWAIAASGGVPRMRPVHADLCFPRLDMWGYPAL